MLAGFLGNARRSPRKFQRAFLPLGRLHRHFMVREGQRDPQLHGRTKFKADADVGKRKCAFPESRSPVRYTIPFIDAKHGYLNRGAFLRGTVSPV